MISELNGMPVHISLHAVKREPWRTHVHKPGQSANYHKRIQKKWIKRWGWHDKPAAYQMNGMLVVHPDIAANLQAGARHG